MNIAKMFLMIAVACFAGGVSLNACSLAGCLDQGIETEHGFSVLIRHDHKPLEGASIEITGNGKKLNLITLSDGKTRVGHLTPGLHWLNAQFLGISAVSECPCERQAFEESKTEINL